MSTDKQLSRAIEELPRKMSPRKDLWPGISSRLGQAGSEGQAATVRQSWFRQAIAASIAVAFVAGLMFGRQMDNGGTAAPELRTMDYAMQATLEATEREYQAAFREFIPVGSARALLANQDVEHIEDSWAEMQQAETALLAALHDYPDNFYLNQKLFDLRARQLGFMRQLATLDQFSRRKT